MWLKSLSRSKLIRGSAVVFIGNNILSFGNFLYNLAMGRMLGPEKYGDLGALFSILALLSTPLYILGLFIVKQTSSYWGQRAYGKIYALHTWLNPKLFIASSVATIII